MKFFKQCDTVLMFACIFLLQRNPIKLLILWHFFKHVKQFEAGLCETADFLTVVRFSVWEVKQRSLQQWLTAWNRMYASKFMSKNVCRISKKRWRACARAWVEKRERAIRRCAAMRKQSGGGGLCVCMSPHLSCLHPVISDLCQSLVSYYFILLCW